jgi:hypothetical protein
MKNEQTRTLRAYLNDPFANWIVVSAIPARGDYLRRMPATSGRDRRSAMHIELILLDENGEPTEKRAIIHPDGSVEEDNMRNDATIKLLWDHIQKLEDEVGELRSLILDTAEETLAEALSKKEKVPLIRAKKDPMFRQGKCPACGGSGCLRCGGTGQRH